MKYGSINLKWQQLNNNRNMGKKELIPKKIKMSLFFSRLDKQSLRNAIWPSWIEFVIKVSISFRSKIPGTIMMFHHMEFELYSKDKKCNNCHRSITVFAIFFPVWLFSITETKIATWWNSDIQQNSWKSLSKHGKKFTSTGR